MLRGIIPSKDGMRWEFHDHGPTYDGSDRYEIRAVSERSDTESILDGNKRIQNTGDGYTKDRSWQHIATIPNSVILKWKTDEGIDVYNKEHLPAVNRKLNDPEYRYLRTGMGMLRTKGFG